MAGRSWDDLFAYETQKVVRIHDRRLGWLYYSLVCMILAFVLGYQMLYNNEHFMKKDVEGTTRMTIQQPTKKGCNPNDPSCLSDFRSLEELPYCSDYRGPEAPGSQYRQKCVFADQHTLSPTGMLQSEMLIPTRIDQSVEHKNCQPSASNGHTCDNEYTVDAAQEIIYVADIERYTLLIANTFQRDHLRGNNGDMQGYYLECEHNAENTVLDALDLGGQKCVRKPIECMNSKCRFLGGKKKKDASFLQRMGQVISPGWRATIPWDEVEQSPEKRHHLHRHRGGHRLLNEEGGPLPDHQMSKIGHRFHSEKGLGEIDQADPPSEADAAEAAKKARKKALIEGGVFAIPDGDVISIKKLLQLSGLDLDGSHNYDGEPLREAGTVIEIIINYENMHPFFSSFGMSPITYTYQVKRRHMEEMKSEMLSPHQPNYPQERIIENRHGLYITVKTGGQFGFFSFMYFVVQLTAAAGLVAVATVLTDKIAIYILARKAQYRKHKYEETENAEDEKDEDA